MANHVLSLEVPTVMNECILKILDTSVYQTVDPTIPIICPTLNITVPGFNYSNQIEGVAMTNFVNTGHITLTACDLQLQTSNCGTQYFNLPDGIYVIKYSVSPNEIVYVEYNHLRISHALNKYYRILCDVDVAACDPPYKIKERLEELRLIFMYLQSAKSKVEFCLEAQKGMSLYNYAIKLLNKLSCTNC
jgi:hypothetical protein